MRHIFDNLKQTDAILVLDGMKAVVIPAIGHDVIRGIWTNGKLKVESSDDLALMVNGWGKKKGIRATDAEFCSSVAVQPGTISVSNLFVHQNKFVAGYEIRVYGDCLIDDGAIITANNFIVLGNLMAGKGSTIKASMLLVGKESEVTGAHLDGVAYKKFELEERIDELLKFDSYPKLGNKITDMAVKNLKEYFKLNLTDKQEKQLWTKEGLCIGDDIYRMKKDGSVRVPMVCTSSKVDVEAYQIFMNLMSKKVARHRKNSEIPEKILQGVLNRID